MSTDEKIYLLGITKEQLAELVAQEVTHRFHSIARASVVDEKRPMSIDQASDFTGLAKQTIYKGTSEGTIPFHKNAGKLWFFRDELIAWIRGESPNRPQAKTIHKR